MRTKRLSFALLVWSAANVYAQEPTIAFPTGIQFETGDTWLHDGRRYRLFGVQACLRGTTYRMPEGREGDCGMRSIASLAALFATGTIACQSVGTANDGMTALVVCAAQVGGNTVDVGTAVISAGVAFAAALPSGEAVSPSYAVAEAAAKAQQSGLWRGEFEHPVRLLLDR